MNQDSNPQPIDPQLEARIVALVLGEASDFERDQLDLLIEQRPELASLKRQIQTVHGLLHDAGTSEAVAESEEWKLSADKRSAVLAVIDGGSEESNANTVVAKRGDHRSGSSLRRLIGIAAVFVFAASVGMMTLMRSAQHRLADASQSAPSAPSADVMNQFDAEIRMDSVAELGARLSEGLMKDARRGESSSGSGRISRRDFSKKEASNAALSAIRDSLGTNAPLDSLATNGVQPSPYYLQDDVQYFPATPAVPTPHTVTPQIATPQAAVPEVALSDVSGPGLAAPSFAASEFATPDESAVPQISVSNDAATWADSDFAVAETPRFSNGPVEAEQLQMLGEPQLNFPRPSVDRRAAGRSASPDRYFYDTTIDGEEFGGVMEERFEAGEIAAGAKQQPVSGLAKGLAHARESVEREMDASGLSVGGQVLDRQASQQDGQGQAGAEAPDLLFGGMTYEGRVRGDDQTSGGDQNGNGAEPARGFGLGGGGYAGGGIATVDKYVEQQASGGIGGESNDWIESEEDSPIATGALGVTDLSDEESVAGHQFFADGQFMEPAPIRLPPAVPEGEPLAYSGTTGAARAQGVPRSVELVIPEQNRTGIATYGIDADTDGDGVSDLAEAVVQSRNADGSVAADGGIELGASRWYAVPSEQSKESIRYPFERSVGQRGQLSEPARDKIAQGTKEEASKSLRQLDQMWDFDPATDVGGESLPRAYRSDAATYWERTNESKRLERFGRPQREQAPLDVKRGESKFAAPAADAAPKSRLLGLVPKSVAPEGIDEKDAGVEAVSTFSLHVSDVAFKLARASLAQGEWPKTDMIRIEEFVNAFDYGDPMPSESEKIACRVEQAIHPFLQQRNLLRVSMRTAATGRASQTPLRLTLLLDNSGSMERIDRRETVRRAFALLSQQLKPIDQVTLISFARQPRLLADKVSGGQAEQLNQLVQDLPSEGGTNIEAALRLAFEKAQEQRVENAQNRVILLTDGAVNLGNANPNSLAKMIATMRNAGIAFDAAGISAEGLNDEILEALTRRGDGRYYLLDFPDTADAGFARQIAGALRPSAMNVKVQVEFNPKRVGSYKLLGFEKHRLKKEDFRNDKVDAAELAAAEAGVALYQFEAKPDGVGDVGSVSVRFRDVSTGRMVENRWPIPYEAEAPRVNEADPRLRIAGTAGLLAAKLRGETLGETVDLQALSGLVAGLPEPYRSSERVQQLQQMIQQARQTVGK